MHLSGRFLAVLVVALSGCAPPPGEAVFRVESPSLRAAVKRAARRLEAASGIALSFAEHGAPIVYTHDLRCEGTPSSGCTRRRSSFAAAVGSLVHAASGADVPRLGEPFKIEIDRSKANQPELDDIVLHELWHWFGVNGHSGDGVRTKVARDRAPITADNLVALCSVAACSVFVPEAR